MLMAASYICSPERPYIKSATHNMFCTWKGFPMNSHTHASLKLCMYDDYNISWAHTGIASIRDVAENRKQISESFKTYERKTRKIVIARVRHPVRCAKERSNRTTTDDIKSPRYQGLVDWPIHSPRITQHRVCQPRQRTIQRAGNAVQAYYQALASIGSVTMRIDRERADSREPDWRLKQIQSSDSSAKWSLPISSPMTRDGHERSGVRRGSCSTRDPRHSRSPTSTRFRRNLSQVLCRGETVFQLSASSSLWRAALGAKR
jgi:hypothetical protein